MPFWGDMLARAQVSLQKWSRQASDICQVDMQVWQSPHRERFLLKKVKISELTQYVVKEAVENINLQTPGHFRRGDLLAGLAPTLQAPVKIRFRLSELLFPQISTVYTT